MDATPIRNCDYETNEAGMVTLIIPKFKNKKFNDFMLGPRKRYFRVTLEELGSAVWLQIDSHSKVADICTKVYETFGEKIMPVEERVTKFLTTLYESRYITFAEIENESEKISG